MGMLAGLFLVSIGCTHTEPKPVETKAEDSVEVLSIAGPTTMGSLWEENNGRAYMFEDLRPNQLVVSHTLHRGNIFDTSRPDTRR